jgi:glutathione S-transferase
VIRDDDPALWLILADWCAPSDIQPRMILIGQYDSPFVRRIGITLRIQGLPFEHRPWSVFADADQVRQVSPLGRVPILVLDGGDVLPDSHSILAYLDGMPGAQALALPGDPGRLAAFRRTALAVGLAEKAVALVYETRFHDHPSASVVQRIEGQIHSTLNALELDCAAAAQPFWQGTAPGHADIALACAAHFVAEVHPGLLHHPAIAQHILRCEALPAFHATRQAFRPPA